MKIIRYQEGTHARTGLLLDDGVVNIGGLAARLPGNGNGLQNRMAEWLAGYPSTDWKPIRLLEDWVVSHPGEVEYLSPAALDYLPPVGQPGKIVCVGMNYPGAQPAPDQAYPTLFLKATGTLTGHCHPVVIPKVSQAVFSEVELAVVIGRAGKHIPRQDAWEYIAGFTIANDIGALDLESRTSQWQTGKLSDTFLPLGPALVSADEVPDPPELTLRLSVTRSLTFSDHLAFEDNTRSMFFDVPALVAYISSIASLHPGDLIVTGSPKTRDPAGPDRAYIQPGDTLSAHIEGLGVLTNPVTKE